MTVGFSLDVVHDHAMGWEHSTGQWRGGLAAPSFPYDFGLVRETLDTPPVGPTNSNDAQAPQVAKPVPSSPDAREQKNKETTLLEDQAGSERGAETS